MLSTVDSLCFGRARGSSKSMGQVGGRGEGPGVGRPEQAQVASGPGLPGCEMLDRLRTWPPQEGGHHVAGPEGPGFSGPDLSGSLVPFL